MYWKELTTEELSKLDKSIPVIVPIGSIEQHGNHLPVSTDSSINEHFCHHLNKSIPNEILILPTICITCSSHHMEFCGSLTVSHETFYNYVKEIILSIAHHGFTNIIIFNSHGGNQAVAQVIGESLGMKYRSLNVLVLTWWKIISAELLEICEGHIEHTGHACELETSIMFFQNEEQVRKNKIQKGSKIDNIPSWSVSTLASGSEGSLIRSMKEITKNGIQGDPTFATVEKGKKITEAFVLRMKEIVRDFQNVTYKRNE